MKFYLSVILFLFSISQVVGQQDENPAYIKFENAASIIEYNLFTSTNQSVLHSILIESKKTVIKNYRLIEIQFDKADKISELTYLLEFCKTCNDIDESSIEAVLNTFVKHYGTPKELKKGPYNKEYGKINYQGVFSGYGDAELYFETTHFGTDREAIPFLKLILKLKP